MGVIGSSILQNFSDAVQMVGLSLITGFIWPALYWMIRSFVKHPDRRARLWSGQSTEAIGSTVPENRVA